MRLVFLFAALVVSQALEVDNCQAQTRDMRAMVILIRQLRTDMNDSVTALQEKVATQEKVIDDLRTDMHNSVTVLQEKVATQEKVIDDLRIKNDSRQQALHHAVGFSVRHPNTVSGSMTFHSTETNTDQSYNEATGVFTCKTPGYYYFSLSLVKAYSYSGDANCYISKNGNSIAAGNTKPGVAPHTGETTAVANAYVHLATGDTVRLYPCTERASWETRSSVFSLYSGFLVTPDAS